MEHESNYSIFRAILEEEYKKKAKNIDVVELKRENFHQLLLKAREDIVAERFDKAKYSYYSIVDFLNNDPYPDELNLDPEVIYLIKCCFCYSSVQDSNRDVKMDNVTESLVKELAENCSHKLLPKYLNVLFYFKKKEWLSTLNWCHAIKMQQNDVQEQINDNYRITGAMLLIDLDIKSEAQKYEEIAFFRYWATIFQDRPNLSKNEKTEILSKEIGIMSQVLTLKHPYSEDDFKQIFFEQVVPLWTKGGKYRFIDTKTKSFPECNKCIKATIENTTTRGDHASPGSHVNYSSAQTQTDKIKTVNKYTQETGKRRNVEVQVNLDSPLLNTVLDIRNKLLSTQEKKDETITRLSKKIEELNEKIVEDAKQNRSLTEEYQKKIDRQEFEIQNLKKQLSVSEQQCKQGSENNVSLHTLLVEYASDKYNIQAHICKSIEKKSSFMVTYLTDLIRFLTPASIPSNTVVQQNINFWNRQVQQSKADLSYLNNFFEKFKGNMVSSNSFNNTIWPELPDFPKDEDNIVFLSFKPAIKNMNDTEDMLRRNYLTAPLQRTIAPLQTQQFSLSLPQMTSQTPYGSQPLTQGPIAHFMEPRLVCPLTPYNCIFDPPPQCKTVTTETTPLSQQTPKEKFNATKNHCIKNSKSADKDFTSLTKTKVASSKKTKKKFVTLGDPNKEAETSLSEGGTSTTVAAGISSVNRQSKNESTDAQEEKDKIIFDYVIERCPGASENDVTMALINLLDENKGSLTHLSNEKIVEDVKIALGIKRQPAWNIPKSPLFDWTNDDSTFTCTICLESFYSSPVYTLVCRHKFHKKCIKKWLKTKSECPICRIHSVIDEEFPPLH